MQVYRPIADDVQAATTVNGTIFRTNSSVPVTAAVTGKIIKAGWFNEEDQRAGLGLRVVQYDAVNNGYVYYGHLGEVSVFEGDIVLAGSRIGLTGNTGNTLAPALYFEYRKAGEKASEVDFI